MAIGHSMGGLNLRQVGTKPDKAGLYGVITLGTPYKGSYFANSYLDESFEEVIGEMTYDLLYGVRNDPNVRPLVLGLLDFIGQPDLKELFKKEEITLEDLMAIFAKGGKADFFSNMLESPQSIKDLAVGSETLKRLSQIHPDWHCIAMAGLEEDPVFLRFISSMMANSCELELGETTDESLKKLVDYVISGLIVLEDYYDIKCAVSPDINTGSF